MTDPLGAQRQVTTDNVDPEIAELAGPQLVVPINNSRYAVNAANARWGSLFDALYGTDAISEADGATSKGGFNPVRAQKVFEWTYSFLDEAVPLAGGAHWADVTSVGASETGLVLGGGATLLDQAQFAGYSQGAVLFANNGLHIEIRCVGVGTISWSGPGFAASICGVTLRVCDLRQFFNTSCIIIRTLIHRAHFSV